MSQYPFQGLIGTGTGDTNPSLNGRPYATLVSGDVAYGMLGTSFYSYKYSSTETGAQSIPSIIIPNDNTTGIGAWILTSAKFVSLELTKGVAGSGSTSRLLNTYDEGQWFPSVGGNATYSNQIGNYVKTGKKVFISGIIEIALIGTGSTTTISGLDFLSSLTGGRQAITVAYFASLATPVTSITGWISINSTTLDFMSTSSAVSTATGTTPVFQNGTRIDFSGTYLSEA